jgi:hypothetical protein
MLIGYVLEARDDDSYMLGEQTYRPADTAFHDWRFGVAGVPHPATCRGCGRKTDPNFVSSSFRVRRRQRDLTATYDGYLLASRRFRDVCTSARLPGLIFTALPADDDFLWLQSDRVLAFDAAARGTRFERYCKTCSAYYDVIGATPVMLRREPTALGDGFFRTDLEFGSGPEQHPIFFSGVTTARTLASHRLNGVEFNQLSAPR